MTVNDQTKIGNTHFKNTNQKRYFSVIWIRKNAWGFTFTRLHASMARYLHNNRILLAPLLYAFDFSQKFLT